MQENRTLRTLRVARGLSQEQVARRMGVSQAHYSRLERGYRALTDVEQRVVAAALDVPASALSANSITVGSLVIA